MIDTNVWLDLLVFDDPQARRLASRLDQRQMRAWSTAAMRAELADVVGRPKFALDPPRQAGLLALYDGWVDVVDAAPDCRLPCRDPDDRKFLDLAVALSVGRRAAWLLSKDRALLAVRKPAARRFDLRIGPVDAYYHWLDSLPGT